MASLLRTFSNGHFIYAVDLLISLSRTEQNIANGD
jgi:hypothetical protein